MIDVATLQDELAKDRDERILEFARERFIDRIENLLDDPSFVTHPDEEETPAQYFTRLRLLAADLGFVFDEVIASHGTEFERARLTELIRASVE